jgi:hypothetical protein
MQFDVRMAMMAFMVLLPGDFPDSRGFFTGSLSSLIVPMLFHDSEIPWQLDWLISDEVLYPLSQLGPALPPPSEQHELSAHLACLLSNIDIHLHPFIFIGPAK